MEIFLEVLFVAYASLQKEINVGDGHRNKEPRGEENEEGKCWLYFVQLITINCTTQGRTTNKTNMIARLCAHSDSYPM